MNSLRTSRVILIDDEPTEAVPVITALGKLGIGCVYLKGDRTEDLPEKPLSGIRLVILDMRLGTMGTAHEIATMTANVFRRVVSPEQGPLIVLLWTKHSEDLPAFCNALFGLEPKFKPILLIGNLQKPVTGVTAATGRRILRKVVALAETWSPINFLWHWEQVAHDAATDTTALVSTHVSDSSGILEGDEDDERKRKWLSRLKEILRELAAAAGGHNSSPLTAAEDLLETIVAIHGDRVEHLADQMDARQVAGVFAGGPKKLTKAQAAKMNGMALLAGPGTKTGELRPGNVYLPDSHYGRNALFRRTRFEVARVKKEILKNFDADTEYKAHAKASPVDGKAPTPEQVAAGTNRDQRKKTLMDACIPMLLELTPSCDFAQRKRCVIRLVGGLLVPSDSSKIVDGRNDSLRQLDVVAIPGRDGLWMPVFSSRFFYSTAESAALRQTRPSFRIRSQVLADLRNWYSSQSSRPGYLKFDGS